MKACNWNCSLIQIINNHCVKSHNLFSNICQFTDCPKYTQQNKTLHKLYLPGQQLQFPRSILNLCKQLTLEPWSGNQAANQMPLPCQTVSMILSKGTIPLSVLIYLLWTHTLHTSQQAHHH